MAEVLFWCRGADLNRRPHALQAHALPTELLGIIYNLPPKILYRAVKLSVNGIKLLHIRLYEIISSKPSPIITSQ